MTQIEKQKQNRNFRLLVMGIFLIAIMMIAIGVSKTFALTVPSWTVSVNTEYYGSSNYQAYFTNPPSYDMSYLVAWEIWYTNTICTISVNTNHNGDPLNYDNIGRLWFQNCTLSLYKGKIKFHDNWTSSDLYWCYYESTTTAFGGPFWKVLNWTTNGDYWCPEIWGRILWDLTWTMPSSATCSDWIMNQDETDIDYGWVCGICSDNIQNGNETAIDFGGRCGSTFSDCRQRVLPLYGTGGNRSEISDFFSISWATTTIAYSQSGGNLISFWQYSWDLKDQDIFTTKFLDLWIDPSIGLPVFTGSISTSSWTVISTLKEQDSTHYPEVRIESKRGGLPNYFNYVKFTGVTSWIVTRGIMPNVVASANFHTTGGDAIGYFTQIGLNPNGTAIAFLPNNLYADSVSIKFLGPPFLFSWLELGITTSSINVVECAGDNFTCKFQYLDPTGTPTCAPSSKWTTTDMCMYSPSIVTPLYGTGGTVTTVEGPACIAKSSSGLLSPYTVPNIIPLPNGVAVDITTDGSWNLINGTPKTSETPITDDIKTCLGDDPDIWKRIGCAWDAIMKQVDDTTKALSWQSKVISTAMKIAEKTPNKLEDTTIGKTPDARDTNTLVEAGQNAYEHAKTGSSGISQLYRIFYYGFIAMAVISLAFLVIYLLNWRTR